MINILNFIKRTLLKWILNNESYHKYEELNELDSIVDEMIENPIIFKYHKVKLYGLKCIRKFNKLVNSIENVDKITIFLLNSRINIDLFDKCIKHYRENVGNYSEFVEKKIKYLYEWDELVNEFISKSSEIMKNMSNNMYKGKDDIYNG